MGVPWAAILAVALGGGLGDPRFVRFRTAAGPGELPASGRAIGPGTSVERRVQEAREDSRRLGDEARQSAEAQRLRTQTPEAGDWPAEPWPAQEPADRPAAVAALRAETQARLDRSGIAVDPVETDHFLVYADLPRLEAARLGARLESVHEWLAGVLGIDAAAPHYWGKAVVMYVADPDRFRLLEAESFGQLAGRELTAICHPDGAKVFVVLRGDPSGPAAVRAAVHAFMHRYRTPRRLPPWANEGLAWYAAERLAPGAWAGLERRGALEFLRGGGDVRAVLNATYAQGWPGPGGVGPAAGALLVELLVTQKPGAFRSWVGAVKDGKEWATALGDVYGSPARLVDTFVQYYRVND